MKQEDYDFYRRWVKGSFAAAAVYQMIVALHFALMLVRPETDSALLLSIEALLAIGWLLVCAIKNIHTLSGPIPFAGGFGVIYLLYRYSGILMRWLGVSSEDNLWIGLLLTVEAVFFLMLAVTLMVSRMLKDAEND